ncbi:MAG: ABC transporter ATP-binding protein [Mogibacterium sp.]|jgi:teichoic acid transport system ATP-binding protein|nr:ABC transporter ATP-binding protein [Mogibacterium sp.]
MDNEKDIAIRFDHVTKEYKLYKNDKARFKGLFNKKIPYKTNKAVNDLSFTVRRGDAVSLIGRNGAGKSTILKIITGVTFPTSGTVEVNGKISALLELSAGFDKEFTGRENIYLKCELMGMSQEEIKAVEPDIVAFADLGEYIDQPLRAYSSGMKSRLGFAISVNVQPDILIVDEALSVGDRKFRKKCKERVREIMADETVTLLFVTHSLDAAKDFCKRGIVLERGKKLFDGEIDEAIEFYDAREE